MNTSLAGKKIGKDAINENFNLHDLRGTDFSGVNVTDSSFCGAVLGRAPATTFWLLLLQALLIAAASYFVILGNAFAAWFIEVQIRVFGIYSASNLIFILMIYAILFSCSAFISLRYTKWALPAFITMVLVIAGFAANEANDVAKAREGTVTNTVVGTKDGFATENRTGSRVGAGPRAVDGPAALSGAIVGAGLGTILVLVVVASIVAGAGHDTKVRSLFVVASLAGAGLAIQTYTATLTDSIAQAGSSERDARVIAEVITWAGAGAGFVFLLFGVYLGVRAIKREEPELLFIRYFGIGLNSLGATEFANATLHDCDFSGADLKHVRFRKALFKGCNFKNAENAHLALTRGTPLESRKVRDLVIHGTLSGNDRNFAGLNLHGLDFRHSGQDTLRNANFTKADLSFANFSGCDLSAVDLSEVNALGARFSGCKLTGACIQHWNIDSRTDLTGIDCDFVYTRLDPKLRNANGEFKRDFPTARDGGRFRHPASCDTGASLHGGSAENAPGMDAQVRRAQDAQEPPGAVFRPPNKNDRFDRNPPEGKFAPGDFTRIYKALPATIDFVVKNKLELNALLGAIEGINAGADSEKVTVQGIKVDRKGEGCVVKLEPQQEFDSMKLYAEINEKKERIIQLEEELQAREIERETQEKETRCIFHDINNNALSLDFILHDSRDAIFQNDSKKAQEYIDRALEIRKRSQAFFGEIMKTSGGIELSHFDVRLLADDVIKECRSLAEKHKVQLILSGNPDEKAIINSDRHYLKRVLANLVVNGIKYADTSRSEAAMVTIAIANHAQTVVVDIIDNGIGIPPGEHADIWKDGYRAGNAGPDIEGSGLGLPFVRKTMDRLAAHQIQLAFSAPGAGTCFRLRLPKGVDEPAIIQPDYPLEGLYVFLVEKDLAVRRSWIALMEANGAEYEAVNSTEELRALLPTLVRYPDVVVIGYRPSGGGTAADALLALESVIHQSTPTLIIADEATGVSIELPGKTLLRNLVTDQQLLAEIIRLGRDPHRDSAWAMQYPSVPP